MEPPSIPSSADDAVQTQKVRRLAESAIPEWKPVEPLSLETARPEDVGPEQEFYVGRIVLEGNELIPEERLREMLAPFEERTHTLASLNAVCRMLESEYQKKGVITVVYLPPQRMEKQQATLRVVISKLGRVEVEGAQYFRPERLRDYWTIRAGETLSFDAMRRDVLRMNENPDRSVRIAMKAGTEPGRTDIFLVEKDRYPIHAGAVLDNQGSQLTGKLRPSVYVVNNNATGHDDTLLANIAGTTDMKAFYLYHSFPIPMWDLKLNTHWSHSAVAPAKEFVSLDISGVTDDFGFELRRRVLRLEDRITDVFAGIDFGEKRTIALGQVITRDRLRTPYVGFEHQSADPAGIWSLTSSVTTGLPFKEEAVNLTSRQAGSSFAKVHGQVKRFQKMPHEGKLLVDLQGQWTPNELVPQEQLFMGGADSVRGYPESDYGADQGYLLKIEYHHSASFLPADWKLPHASKALKEQLDLFAFFDHGYGWLVNPSEIEHSTRNLASVGVGATLVFNEHFEASLSWGVPIADPMLTESGASQLHFRIRTQF